MRDDLGGLEAVGVDVHQADGSAGQLGIAKNVTQKVLCEDRTAGADEGDFHGCAPGFLRWQRHHTTVGERSVV